MLTRAFIKAKVLGLAARLPKLARIDARVLGLRAIDSPYVPSPIHFAAANRRLAAIERNIHRRFEHLAATWRSAPLQRALVDIALVEREQDRARRAFGMFFEVFAQRGTSFGPTLAAHDAIAQDCYQAVRDAAPRVFDGPLIKPVCYMEHGYSPATMRRGVALSRLLGEPNPFPLIRIPWDRDQPWQPVFLHEVAHNLQADLGIWQENRQAVVRRLFGQLRDPMLARIYGHWHKEIFADLAALLLGGPAAAWGMAEFLAQPAPRTLTYRPGGAHPTAYLRVMILAEMLRRMGFPRHALRLTHVWNTLYSPARGHRLPARLLASADQAIPQVVDEIAFQTRRNLAQWALADIIPFAADDERAIREATSQLARGATGEIIVPPRHLVSAAAYALGSGRVDPAKLSRQVIEKLNEMTGTARTSPRPLILAA